MGSNILLFFLMLILGSYNIIVGLMRANRESEEENDRKIPFMGLGYVFQAVFGVFVVLLGFFALFI